MYFVPVIDKNQKPLMPTNIRRAKKWILSHKATPFYKKGIFCVRLNVEPSDNKKQMVVVGIDPGLKREAYTIKSNFHTYLNILSGTIDWVHKKMKQRKIARKSRRFRKTRRRETRFDNRTKSKIAPSIKARWDLKLKICEFLKKIFNISVFVIEDIKAVTKGVKNWDKSFGPLERGKNWFYTSILKLGNIILKQGYETKKLREKLSLNKSKNKLKDEFECHNVDSWVLANDCVGGHKLPDNKSLFRIFPIKLYRRQLHTFQFTKGGIRKNYGGTRSLGLKKGSLVKHVILGLTYIGGKMNNRVSLHDIKTGERIFRSAKTEDCKFLAFSNWRCY